MFALKRTSLGSVLDCVAPCLEESLLSLAKLRLEEVWRPAKVLDLEVCLANPHLLCVVARTVGSHTYCRAALEMRPRLPYGGVHHLQGRESDFQHSMVFQNIYHIGDIKSAPRTGGLFTHAPRKAEVVLWNPVY